MHARPHPAPRFLLRLRVREVRQTLRYQAGDVAALLTPPRSRRWLLRLETGATLPTIQQLVQLAGILHVTPWWSLVELVPVGATLEAHARTACLPPASGAGA